jgi:hypothetical protein
MRSSRNVDEGITLEVRTVKRRSISASRVGGTGTLALNEERANGYIVTLLYYSRNKIAH